MIDLGRKLPTVREAVVEAKVYIKPLVIKKIKAKTIPKGDVLAAAKVAGILAAKKTPFLLPLCHPLPIEYAAIDFLIEKKFVLITATVRAEAKTGVEMEALTACSIAALTIYDMCKGLDREITVTEMKLLKKTGGKSDDFIRGSKVKKNG